MIVVDDGHALVGVALGLQRLPAFQAVRNGVHPLRHRLGKRQSHTGVFVNHFRLRRSQHHRLTDPLELGHRQFVVHLVRRNTIDRQLPLVGGAGGQAQTLDHRHIQPDQRFRDLTPTLTASNNKVLKTDNTG